MKKTNQSFIKTIVILFLFFLISNPSQTKAQSPTQKNTAVSSDKYTVLAPLPCIESAPTTYTDSAGNTQTNPGIQCDGGNGSLQKQVDFKTYVQYTINLLMALSAVTAVIMIIWGGIEYMWSASFSDKKMGLDRAKNAIYGLLLVLTSYIILRTIDPRFVEIPNTLVPQLTVKEWLKSDVSTALLKQIENDISLRDTKTSEIGEERINIRKEIAVNKKNAEQIQTAIDDALKENPNPETNTKLLPLLLEKQKIERERKELEAASKIKEAENNFNSILLETALIVSQAAESSATKLIDQLRAKDKEVDIQYNIAIGKMRSIELSDSTPITEQMLYTKAIIDLSVANLMITDKKLAKEELLTKEFDKINKSIISLPTTESGQKLKLELQNRLSITISTFEKKLSQ